MAKPKMFDSLKQMQKVQARLKKKKVLEPWERDLLKIKRISEWNLIVAGGGVLSWRRHIKENL